MRKFVLSISCLIMAFWVQAQNDLTFYHLGPSTPQSASFNPSYFPDARFYISFPVISGISVDTNSELSYNDVMSRTNSGDSLVVDVESILTKLQDGDRLRSKGTISLFQLGFRVGDRSAFSVFVNDRYSSSAYYPKSTLAYFAEGNANFLDETVTENYLSARGIYFREIGIGFVQELEAFGGNKVRFGIRGKYLQGILQAQTNPNASVEYFTSSEDYQMNFSFTNPEIQTAGLSMVEGDSIEYFIQNRNSGFGIDVGLDIDLTSKFSIALAVNDIGQITWQQGVENYGLENEEITLPDLDLSNLDEAGTYLRDTLTYLFSQETNSDKYTTTINPRYVASVRYKIIPKGTFTGTALLEKERSENFYKYGIGYTHRVGNALTVSSTGSYNKQDGFDVGGALTARLGIMQLYASVDRITSLFEATDVTNAKSVNFRVGINFLFGHQKKHVRIKEEKQEVSPFPEEYDLDHIKDIAE